MRQWQTDFWSLRHMNIRMHPRSILEQARILGPDVTEMRAIKHTMELIAHSLCIANGAPAKVAREGWLGKTALLSGQSMGTKSELHQNPELTDAHWQLIVGLKSQITRPAKPMVICHIDWITTEGKLLMHMLAGNVHCRFVRTSSYAFIIGWSGDVSVLLPYSFANTCSRKATSSLAAMLNRLIPVKVSVCQWHDTLSRHQSSANLALSQ